MSDSPSMPDNPFLSADAEGVTRQIDSLIGVCRGVLLDGVVTEGEANGLLRWLDQNREVADRWPANVLYARVQRAMADGRLDPEEERDLIQTLAQITGDPDSVYNGDPGALPINEPAPDVLFAGREFCFAGRFVTGRRTAVAGLAQGLGAVVADEPVERTDYLVVGTIGSQDWARAAFGPKIERAVALRESGCGIAILTEEHWVSRVAASGAH